MRSRSVRRIWLEVDHCPGPSTGYQVQICDLDEKGAGSGDRLAGPSYIGNSTRVVRFEITAARAAQMKPYIDRALAAATTDDGCRLRAPAPETEETSRSVARVEELTRQLAAQRELLVRVRAESGQTSAIDDLFGYGPAIVVSVDAYNAVVEALGHMSQDEARAALEVQP